MHNQQKTLIAKIIIKRPSWEGMEKAYEDINKIYEGGNNEAVFRKIFHTNELYNTCAIRLSYAFNYGGMPIANELQNSLVRDVIGGMLRKGKDNLIYITGAWDMGKFLDKLWGEKDEDKYFDFNKITLDDCIRWLKVNKNDGIIVMKSTSKKIKASDITGHTTIWHSTRQCLGDYQYVGVKDRNAELEFKHFIDRIDIEQIRFWKL